MVLPGITSPAVTWGFVAERLGEKYDVYVLDARGRGFRKRRATSTIVSKACAADVGDFFRRWVCPAMHCSAILWSAGCTSVREEISGRARTADESRSARKRAWSSALSDGLDWYLKSIEQMARGGGNFELLKPFLPTWSEESLRLRAEWLHTCDLKAVTEAYESFHEDDMHSDLPLLVPTLLIAAGKGDVIRPEELDEVLSLSKSMRAVRVEKAGHMIPWDDESGFFEALGDFLSE